jgi:hypothetical protein
MARSDGRSQDIRRKLAGTVVHEAIVHGTVAAAKSNVTGDLPSFLAIDLTKCCPSKGAARCTIAVGVQNMSPGEPVAAHGIAKEKNSMSKLLLTGTAGTPRAACAAAIVAGVALSGCAASPDYVKPTATTAARASEAAPGRPAGASGTAENSGPEGSPAAKD